jgi:hypothetical protein
MLNENLHRHSKTLEEASARPTSKSLFEKYVEWQPYPFDKMSVSVARPI